MKAIILAIVSLLVVACIADEVAVSPPKIPVLACTICQNVISKIEAGKTTNVTLAWLQAQVKAVCAKYNVNDWCTKNIWSQLPMILMWIQKNGSPDRACQSIKLCKNTTRTPPPPIHAEETEAGMFKNKNKTKPHAGSAHHESALAKNGTKKPPFHGTGINCAVCENVLAGLEKIITSNESATKLAADLTTICSKLFLGDWCAKNLKAKIPSLLTKLKAKTDPAVLCKATKFCRNVTRTPKPPKAPKPSSAEDEQAKPRGPPSKPTPPKPSKPMEAVKRASEGVVKCDICTAIIAEVQSLVGSNTTEAAITKALDKACGKIPFAKNLCLSIIVPALAQIVEGIVAKQDPTQICTNIKMCSPSVDAEEFDDEEDDGSFMGEDDEVEEVVFDALVEKREAEMNIECGICDAVISYVKSTIGSDLSSAAVKKAINNACGKIPFAKAVCSTVIEPFITQIVEGVIAKQDPTAICKKIKLCK